LGDIFREIDEELRQEKFDKLWRRYGKFVIAAVVVLVLAVAGYKGWQQYQTSQRVEDGARFATAKALLQNGKTEDARALFAALGRESGTIYGDLSRFHSAALLAKTGDLAGAVEAYRKIAADSSISRPLRDLAVVLGALNSMNDPSADLAALSASLKPLSEAGNPWRYSALEIMALIAQKSGDTATARGYFQRLVDDPEAASGVRGRASQMLAILGAK
jgi:hypothetical protein